MKRNTTIQTVALITACTLACACEQKPSPKVPAPSKTESAGESAGKAAAEGAKTATEASKAASQAAKDMPNKE